MIVDYSTNYSGRQADLEYLQTVDKPRGTIPVSRTVGARQPKGVAGLQKMLQRYVVLLLTRIGDVYLKPEQGTRFIEQLIRGGGRSRGYLSTAFAFASVDVISQMRHDDSQEDLFGVIPDDEQISIARLLNYEVDVLSRTLSLRIYLESQAGPGAEYIVPVPVPRS